jgi:hypothetical protein
VASRRRSRQSRRQQPTTPQTAAELFLDALIRHQIGLVRSAGGYRRRVFELLDAVEGDLRRQITARVRAGAGVRGRGALRRLERLLEEVAAIRRTPWREVGTFLREQLRELAEREPGFMSAALRTVVPVSVVPVLPDASRLRAIVSTEAFQGAVLQEHLSRLAAADVRRIQDQIRIGLAQGESGPQVARRIVGTVRLRGRNGVTEVTRRHAATIVRTATSAIASKASREFSLANAELFTEDLFVATLDSKTTPICRSLDGERFPIEQAFPDLPLHYGERSRRVPSPDPEALGKRPMKPTTERMLLREFAEAEGIEPVSKRSRLPRGYKGRFDQFSRRRVRELVGRVPAKVDYETFLRRQPASFVDDPEILGPTRGRLFRRGGLSLDAFVERPSGRLITLDELAQTEAAAFRAAGLDPEDFFE